MKAWLGFVSEAPNDGAIYGRGGNPFPDWTEVLPITGGTLTGNLNLPNGTLLNPALQIGAADDTGFSDREQHRVVVAGLSAWMFNQGLTFVRTELDMGGNSIHSLLDPVSPQDAATKIYVDTAVATG